MSSVFECGTGELENVSGVDACISNQFWKKSTHTEVSENIIRK